MYIQPKMLLPVVQLLKKRNVTSGNGIFLGWSNTPNRSKTRLARVKSKTKLATNEPIVSLVLLHNPLHNK
jgi:hypothetical protein